MVRKINEYYKYNYDVFAIDIYNNGEFVGWLKSTYTNWDSGITVIYTNHIEDAQKFDELGGKYSKSYTSMLKYLKRFGKNENDAIENEWQENRQTVGNDGINITFEAENITDGLNDNNKKSEIYQDRQTDIRQLSGTLGVYLASACRYGMSENDYQDLLAFIRDITNETKTLVDTYTAKYK